MFILDPWCEAGVTRTWKDVTVCGGKYRITATVSCDADDINRWIAGVYSFHHRRISEGGFVAGLGVQWRPLSGPPGRRPASTTAVVQICVGRRCLIVQLGRCTVVPENLRSFLDDVRVSFVGVGIRDDVRRLGFRGLLVGNPMIRNSVEAREMAVAVYGPEWSNASMADLADLVLGIQGVTKDWRVGCSDWEAEELSSAQVEYACEDAHIAFLLGVNLLHSIKHGDAGNSIPMISY